MAINKSNPLSAIEALRHFVKQGSKIYAHKFMTKLDRNGDSYGRFVVFLHDPKTGEIDNITALVGRATGFGWHEVGAYSQFIEADNSQEIINALGRVLYNAPNTFTCVNI